MKIIDTIIQNSAYWPRREGLTKPCWDMIYQAVGDDVPYEQLDTIYCRLADHWLRLVASELGECYRLHIEDDFRAVTPVSEQDTRELVRHAKRSITACLELLPGIASDEGYGPHVLIMAANHDDYYNYISAYTMTDESLHMGASAGVCLRHGYNHVVINDSESWYQRHTITHEYAHTCLSGLYIPGWLEEGIVELVTMAVNDEMNEEVSLADISRQREYWTANGLQDFWSGKSFHQADDGQHLSYQLAVWITHELLTHRRPALLNALNKLDETDEPTTALCAALGTAPADILPAFLRSIALE